MDYETVAKFAQTWGLVYFALLFGGIVLYALWPGNQKQFDEAARIPLDDGPLNDGPLDDEEKP